MMGATENVDFSAFARPTSLSPSEALHRKLARWNRRRFLPAMPSDDWEDGLNADHAMQRLEGAMIEQARGEIAARAAEAPGTPEAFVAWFEALEQNGPGQGDPLFPWLAENATLEQMRWFVCQEAAGEAGFDDLVAMTQVKLPSQAKLELARNYWDEMGRGNAKGMHGPMLEELSNELKLAPRIDTTVWQSLALANTMAAFAANRRYAFHSIGALGVIEQTAPGRAALVAKGLKRLGIGGRARHYFDLHAVLDVRHSAAWNSEALAPLVAEQPECARYIAEGALMRLARGKACFDVYRARLWAH